MKKVLFLFAMTAFSLATFAQQTNAVNPTPGPTAIVEDSLGYTFEQYQSRMFGALNFSSVSSGYMLERSLVPFTKTAHDGLGTDDEIITKLERLNMLHSTLVTSQVNSNANLTAFDVVYNGAKS